MEDFEKGYVLKSIVFKIQYIKKKWILNHPEFHPQNNRPLILPFDKHLPDLFYNWLESISDLKVICAQSWGHIEALKNFWSPKTSL